MASPGHSAAPSGRSQGVLLSASREAGKGCGRVLGGSTSCALQLRLTSWRWLASTHRHRITAVSRSVSSCSAFAAGPLARRERVPRTSDLSCDEFS